MKEIKIGDRFERLVVKKVVGARGGSFLCKCDCGKKRVLIRQALLTRHNTSCGCMAGKQGLRHGMAAGQYSTNRHRFYRIWDGIKKRTRKPENHNYPRYGGRGIECEWPTFFEFHRDMFQSYQCHVKRHGEKDTTLDRKDNDGNYSKDNCRWVRNHIQANNRTTNRYVTYKGKRYTCSQLCLKLGINYKWFMNQLRYKTAGEVIKSTQV